MKLEEVDAIIYQQLGKHKAPASAWPSVRLIDLTGVGANNKAEYRALISARSDLRGRIVQAAQSPRNHRVAVHTDSRLAAGPLTEGWQVKASNLRPPRDEPAALMRTFGLCWPSMCIRSYPTSA